MTSESLGVIFDWCWAYGVWITLGADGRPEARGGRPPPWLLGLLRESRAAVIAHIKNARLREWATPGGYIYREDGRSMASLGRYDQHPASACLWRFQSEPDWRVVGGKEDVAGVCLRRLRGQADELGRALPPGPLPDAGAPQRRPQPKSLFVDG